MCLLTHEYNPLLVFPIQVAFNINSLTAETVLLAVQPDSYIVGL